MRALFKTIRISDLLLALALLSALGAVGYSMDRLDRRVHQQELRLDTSARLEILRARLENEIDSSVRATRSMAALVSGADDISQDRYSNFAAEIIDDLAGVINITWAPDLIVTHIYPINGNEAVMGLDYRTLPEQLDGVLQVRDTGTAAVFGPLDLIQGARGLILRMPVFEATDTGPSFRGILSLVFDLDAVLDESLATQHPIGLDVALETDKIGRFSNSETVLGNADVLQDNPVSASLVIPERNWTLYARPAGGWPTASSHSWSFRVLMVSLLLIVMVASLWGIWLAHSRRRTIQQMVTSDQLLKGAIRNAPGVFFTCHETEAGTVQIDFISDACQDVFECEPDAFYQDAKLFESLMDPDQRKHWQEAVAKTRSTKSSWNYVWNTTTPSGQNKWLQGWGHTTPIEGGRMRWDNFIMDVTDVRHQEKRYERQTQIAHQAQKRESIGQLTGGVAHDFNNLLAVIMGNLELLRDDIYDPEHLHLIDSSITATKRGADLTRNMLAFARKAPLAPSLINLNKLATETRNWIGRTLPAHIDVETSLLAGLWAIEADLSSTESALLNLILNARDAMPEGGKLTIETANVRIDEAYLESRQEDLVPGRYVMLAVSDTGQGIPAESHAQIFEPFYSTKAPGSGSGLGLSMIQGFMDQSGGTVRVYSEPGVGTTFKLFFRAQESVLDGPEQIRTERMEHAQNQYCILLAEDENDVRDTLVSVLEKAGYQVTAAKTGDEALAIFQSAPGYDLLLTDIVMPGKLQGPGLSRALRALDPHLPVVFMSGYASEATVHGNGLRPEDIRLMKPVMRSDLLEAIRKSIGRLADSD